MIDIPSGFTGFTIDVFGGSTSDSEGDVTKALFAITYQERVNDVDFQITSGPDDWSAMMPTGEYIGLKNPKVLFSNRDSAIVQFDMNEKYPSNSFVNLCYRSTEAKFTVNETDEPEKPFVKNTIIGAIGFTSNEYGGATDDEGQVSRILFNIAFANRKNEVEFLISEEPDDWAVLMGDGSYINLVNPNVLFQNRDGATIVFQMKDVYPSSAPGFLVRRRKEANYTITEIDEDHPFIPVQQIVFPTYLPAGERINLYTQVVVYPMNSTLRGIEWGLISPGSTGAEVSNGWITTVNPGKIVLQAKIPSGLGLGSDFKQDVEAHVIDNWITIENQPHLDEAAIAGKIDESINVIATTFFGELTYQWYKNSTPSNESGTAIAGAQSASYNIPKGLVPGEYYYFCEIRKVNFPSVRTDVATVRVRDELVSLDIYPPAASIPPGSTQQFAITRNPQTSDELAIVTWHSDNHHIVTIDQNGLARAHNPGVTTISANIGNVVASIKANTIYTPVRAIPFTYGPVLETGSVYELPRKVEPANASNQSIIWNIVSAGTTATTIGDGKIIPNGTGTLTLRATVKKGSSPSSDFVQEYVFSVIKGHVPVQSVTMEPLDEPRVGEIIALKGTVSPVTATNVDVTWRVKNAGSTGAKISAGNIVTFTGTGNCVLQAVVKNGLNKTTDYTKDFPITVKPKFIPVAYIKDFPKELQYYDGESGGYTFTASVEPANANNKNIIYSISDKDSSGLNPIITDNSVLTFENKAMTQDTEVSIIVNMVVKDGLSEGVDYITESAIAVIPPQDPQVFQPVVRIDWALPSILRAFRPIRINDSLVIPDRATHKEVNVKIKRTSDIGGSSALTFQHSPENHEDIKANGVHFYDEQYGWSDAEKDTYKPPKTYIYPMSKGNLDVTLEIPDAINVNVPYVDKKTLTILDPFIPVKDISNVPSSIYNGTPFCLSPEIDTGDGVDDQTAEWDDRVATFSDMTYRIISGSTVASVNANGMVTPRGVGSFVVRVTVPSGVQEAYTWHKMDFTKDDKPIEFQKIDFVKDFSINILPAENSKKRLLTLKKTNSIGGTETVHIYNKADFELLRSIGPAEGTIPIRGVSTKRSAIKEIYFYDSFNLTDLSNFGRNFINLTKINRIPASAKNLRNFLMGCTKFNQSISIPKGVTGARCLEGFLRGCTSFNKTVIIPSGVRGDKCLESFLRGCTKFNQRITLPEELSGDCCMYSFMQDCTAFNSTITLPKRISGKRCMENVLRNCQNFNQPIVLPEQISGKYNLAAFMFNCNNMTSPVVIPTAECAEGSEHDVITLSTFYKDAKIASGIDIRGAGGESWAEKTGPQPPAGSDGVELVPVRKLNYSNQAAPTPPPVSSYVGVSVINEVAPNGQFDDFQVGDTVKYAVTVINKSEIPVTNVSLVESIPSQVTYVTSNCSKSGASINVVKDDLTYTLKVYGGYGSSPTRVEEIKPGTSVSISVSNDNKKDSFNRWVSDNSDVRFANKSSASTTFTMPSADVVIKATYNESGKYYVEVQDSHLTSGDGSGYYAPGATVTLKANTSDPVYAFKTWQCPDTGASAVLKPTPSGTTFIMPSNHVIVKGDWDVTGTIPPKTGAVKSVNVNIGSMAAGDEVVLNVTATAAELVNNASSTAIVTFAESGRQEDSSENSSETTINIVQTLTN